MNGDSILVVVHSPEEREWLTQVFQPHWTLEMLAPGSAVADLLSRTPALLVLELKAEGMRWLEAWRSDLRTRAIPVLGLVEADTVAREDSAIAEVDDYVVRPLAESQLLARVRSLLRRREREQSLRRREEAIAVLDSLLLYAPLGFALFDRHYRYLRINDVLADINGQPVAAHLGRTLREMVPVNAPLVEPILDRIFASGEPVTEVEIRGETPRATGVVRHWMCSFFPVRVQGRIESVGALVTEITDRKQAEEALLDSDRRKDRFLATLAHELRNPLAPISNALEILRTTDASTEDATYARDLLDRQVRQMVRLIDDLLDVSRLRIGKIELKRERVALDDVVNAALETCRPTIDGNGQELTVALPPQQVFLDADPLRLAQVLANLLNNATKYTGPKGHIRLTAQVEGNWVTIRLRDTGVGIRAELLPRIFEMFRQSVPAGTGGRGGLGVGLGLVKALVEQHGGVVEATSEGLGCGSEFIVKLPLAPDAVPTPSKRTPVPSAPPSKAKRILVVDDSVDAARSLARLLRLNGNEVRTAHDGPSALEAFTAFHPDVTFLDIGMPGMDGYEVARRIRSAGDSTSLLVALTGWGQDEDRRRSQEAGFDLHIVKPVEPEQLRELLTREPSAGVGV